MASKSSLLSVTTASAPRRLSDLDMLSKLVADQNANSEIVNFFRHRSIFLTGATGFLGKAIIAKLLRICPEIQNIYVLIRPKPNATVQMRLENIFNNFLFENLRAIDSSILTKVIPISGDLLLPELGISLEDQKLLETNVTLVINSAATLKFNEDLKHAFNTNVNGVRSLVSLCKRIKDLKALVHLSTAFAHCDNPIIEETIYPASVDPEQLADCLSWMSDELVNKISPLLVGEKPNTYTYTKALAELVLNSESNQLPICIIRPSIVGASWKEPVAGWIDNVNLPTSIFFGVAKGVLRVLKMDGSKLLNLVPLDFTVNLAIVAAWKTATQTSSKVEVYNCCSRMENPIQVGKVMKLMQKYTSENPTSSAYGTPFICFSPNEVIYKLYDFFLHYLPALAFDGLLRIAQKQPQMLKAYRKILRNSDIVSYFCLRDWKFRTENTRKLFSEMSAVDQRLFNFDMNELNWKEYYCNYSIGIRKFLCNEEITSLEPALRRQNKLFWTQIGVVLMAVFVFILIARCTICWLA